MKHYQKQEKFYDGKKEEILKQLRLLVEDDSEVKTQYKKTVAEYVY